MLLPRVERAADYHISVRHTKQQCAQKWSNLKRKNPTLFATVVAEATAAGSPSSSSSAPSSPSAASASVWHALASLSPRARLVYELGRHKQRGEQPTLT